MGELEGPERTIPTKMIAYAKVIAHVTKQHQYQKKGSRGVSIRGSRGQSPFGKKEVTKLGIVCHSAFWTTLFIYLIAGRIWLAIAIKCSEGDIKKVMLTDFIFHLIFLIDVPFILHVTTKMCQ